MATLVTVLRSGGRYDRHWVERLARAFRLHAPGFDRFVCLTDRPFSGDGIECVPLHEDWPVWWSKIEAFRPGLFTGTVLLCDLDTVLCGDASALARPGLAAMEDHFYKGRLSSALLRWEGDDLAEIHRRFKDDAEHWMMPGSCGAVPNAVHGDQVVIDHFLREAGRLPTFFQASDPGLLDFYDPARTHFGPVLVFIGEAKPDVAKAHVQSMWRGD